MGAKAQRGKLGTERWREIARTSHYCVNTATTQYGLSPRQFQGVFADEVGCTHVGNSSRDFKRHFGVPAAEFARSNGDSIPPA